MVGLLVYVITWPDPVWRPLQLWHSAIDVVETYGYHWIFPEFH